MEREIMDIATTLGWNVTLYENSKEMEFELFAPHGNSIRFSIETNNIIDGPKFINNNYTIDDYIKYTMKLPGSSSFMSEVIEDGNWLITKLTEFSNSINCQSLDLLLFFNIIIELQ